MRQINSFPSRVVYRASNDRRVISGIIDGVVTVRNPRCLIGFERPVETRTITCWVCWLPHAVLRRRWQDLRRQIGDQVTDIDHLIDQGFESWSAIAPPHRGSRLSSNHTTKSD
jgi:transposase